MRPANARKAGVVLFLGQPELPRVADGGHDRISHVPDIGEDVPQLFDLVDGEVSAHGGNLGA